MIHRFFIPMFLAVVLGFSLIGSAQAQMGGCSVSYTVQRGDNLFRIARTYNTTIAELQNRNGLTNPNRIYVGQTLCISGGFVPDPAPQPVPSDGWDNLGIVTAYRLNIRSGPGTQFSINRRASMGEGLRLVGRTADGAWYEVLEDPSTGAYAWASAHYISFADPSRIPVVQGSGAVFTPRVVPLVSDATVYAGPNNLTAIPPYELITGVSVVVVGRNADATWFQIDINNGTAWLRLDAFPAALARYDFPITG